MLLCEIEGVPILASPAARLQLGVPWAVRRAMAEADFSEEQKQVLQATKIRVNMANERSPCAGRGPSARIAPCSISCFGR